MKTGYLPTDQRKKILLLSDDMRLPSGVGVMSREIISGTAHRFNWAQVAAAVSHPEQGKRIDHSSAVATDSGVTDASVTLYPNTGYGDQQTLRNIIEIEKPDAILHFTDPRYWIWLYQMEREVRNKMPIMFYHVWDNTPYPLYNKVYYESCDYIAAISRLTYNSVNNILTKRADWQLDYIPHGINPDSFYPIQPSDVDGMEKVSKMKEVLFQGEDVDFVVLYNNRNIRRKMTSDVIFAYREFLLTLSPDQREKSRLVMHTHPIDDNGTDLIALVKDLAPEVKVVFSTQRLSTPEMNILYNCSDVVINLASNEGFGLGTLEAMMTGRMIIANVTGGMQDQMGFVDENGVYLHEDIHYCKEWGTNSDGRYTKHGEWVEPVFPNNRSLNGSPPTPYIFDDRCSYVDAAAVIKKVYEYGADRVRRGNAGREYALKEGFTAAAMCESFINGIDSTLQNWTPRPRFEIHKV